MLTDGKTLLSWLFLIAGIVFGASQSAGRSLSGGELARILGWGYVVWSYFWGLFPFLRWWSRMRSSFRTLRGCLVQLALALVVLPVGSYFYCVLGGGVYQFVKHQLAARPRR